MTAIWWEQVNDYDSYMVRTSKWLWQLYGENKLHFDETMTMSTFVEQHTQLKFYSGSSLKQQSTDRHVAPLGYIILIPSQSVLACTH